MERLCFLEGLKYESETFLYEDFTREDINGVSPYHKITLRMVRACYGKSPSTLQMECFTKSLHIYNPEVYYTLNKLDIFNLVAQDPIFIPRISF